MSMVTKFVLWSLLLLALVAFTGARAYWNNQFDPTPDFTHWQNQYKQIAYTLSNDPAVKQATLATPVEVKQVTVTQFPEIKQDGTQQQRVDRCQSCHVGLGNPQMTAENIIKVVDHVDVPTAQVTDYLDKHANTRAVVETLGAHPGIDIESGATSQDLGVAHSALLPYGVATNASVTDADRADYAVQKENLKRHPFPTFGCTTCHYGSGRELIQTKAHEFLGDNAESDVPEDVPLTPIPGSQMLPAKYMEAACAQCHANYNATTFQINYLPQMTTIARGEQLFKAQACYGCHKIDGFSKGNIGPELTYEGRSRTFRQIAEQLWDPRWQAAARNCVMPYFFALRKTNTDDPVYRGEVVDPRALTTTPADIESEKIREQLAEHGYVPDKSRQADVDALVTFVLSQTGQNYADSQASRFATISAYNKSQPPDVPVTVAQGKQLFEQSGCYACHYIGNPNVKHVTGDPKFGRGGIAGPELSWEGTRHSQEWLIAHYKNPQEFVPGSIMPIFPFSDSQRAALSLWDAAQRPNNPGARPVSADQDLPDAALRAQGAQNQAIRYMTR